MEIKLIVVGKTKSSELVRLINEYVKRINFYKKFKNDKVTTSSAKMRLWNEVATLLLFAIVFLVELQNEMSALIGVGGLIGVSLALMAGIKIYKNYRSKKGE